ncbi:MAG TPA: carboxypeptidase-like regulatory domain-containing protein [Pyrinomonadaceae bacterium]|jgi:hypothetical protein|nr:carboxypeptidase-like regulatory domain-containing protein [Pyrinomonadaceae bacterium]
MNTITKLSKLAPTILFALLVTVFFASAVFVTAQTEKTPAQTTAPAQKPDAKPGPSPPITGTIKGRIVASDGQPLTNANILVQSLTGAQSTKPTRPDLEGRFSFDDLAPGSYVLVATAPGYIDQSMSVTDPNDWPRYLIGANVRVNMIKGGVITGLVTNAKGEPMVGVPVRATMMNVSSLSVLSFVSGGGIIETDDRGSYRIYGLLPGQYLVNTGGNGAFGEFRASGFDRDVPTYYPSSTRDTAVPVSVRSGDETSGIDIKYKGGYGHSISGVVIGDIPANPQGGAVTIMLAHAGTTTSISLELAGIAEPRRVFSFNGVADGEYEVFAGYMASQSENALMDFKRVTLRGGDVTGLELRLAALSSLSGTIILDPIKPEDKCDKRGSLVVETALRVPRDDRKRSGNQSLASVYSGLGQLDEKGEFVLRNLQPARYRLDIKLPSESWYVRAINLPAAATRGQSTAAAQPTAAQNWQGTLTIKLGENLSGVSIAVGQDAAGLRGRLATEGAIREGTRVYLVPVEREQANNVLRYSETFVKSDGSFALTNLAPGRYFIVSRVEAPAPSDASPRPTAWDAAARAKLRLDAEAAKRIVELKPCQQMVDFELKIDG